MTEVVPKGKNKKDLMFNQLSIYWLNLHWFKVFFRVIFVVYFVSLFDCVHLKKKNNAWITWFKNNCILIYFIDEIKNTEYCFFQIPSVVLWPSVGSLTPDSDSQQEVTYVIWWVQRQVIGQAVCPAVSTLMHVPVYHCLVSEQQSECPRQTLGMMWVKDWGCNMLRTHQIT